MANNHDLYNIANNFSFVNPPEAKKLYCHRELNSRMTLVIL